MGGGNDEIINKTFLVLFYNNLWKQRQARPCITILTRLAFARRSPLPPSHHKEFQEKYTITVIARIFYEVDKEGLGHLTRRMCRKRRVWEAFLRVGEEEVSEPHQTRQLF